MDNDLTIYTLYVNTAKGNVKIHFISKEKVLAYINEWLEVGGKDLHMTKTKYEAIQ